jgi:serine/threonine protein phosphatase 1
MTLVKRLPANTAGRDFVIGDIHGTFDLVLEAMRQVGFDGTKDRLFSVGDTVDRGPGSPRAIAFLAQPYVHAIRGNHEDMFLEIYADGEPDEDTLRFCTSRNGMSWWMDLDRPARRALIAAFAKLPVVIETTTARGTVGFIHAEVTPGLTWAAFLANIESGCPKTTEQALWGRGRIQKGDMNGVVGIGRLFVGHTPIASANRLANVYYVDTGAVFGVLDPDGEAGRMTISDLVCSTQVFDRMALAGLVDLRLDDVPAAPTFGSYAKTS